MNIRYEIDISLLKYESSVRKVFTTFLHEDIKDYQNVWTAQKGRNLKMFILGFLLFASRYNTEINSIKTTNKYCINVFIITISFIVKYFVLVI